MLYVNFSSDGRYFNADYVEGASSPVIQKKDGSTMAFANGAHDCGLEVKIDLDADICEVRLAKSNNKTVYILGQESTVSWTADSPYGRKRGEVHLYRLRKTDVVIYEMEPGSWFVSGNVVYHNDNGVLMKYDRGNVIGWETWESLAHWFLEEDVIDYTTITAVDLHYGCCAIPGNHCFV